MLCGLFLLLCCSCCCCCWPLTDTHTHQHKRSSVCYGELGCFSTGGAFTSLHRPISLTPQSPAHIDTKFMLFTRKNPGNSTRQYIRAHDFNSIRHSDFSASRPTKFVCHGFLENGYVQWMSDMKAALLQQGDYNVVLVDWGGGSGIPYTQATANTRVVGAQIAQLIKAMQTTSSARPQDFHLIGHSLGAHICGYAGQRTPNLGRISGLDPADPYFQYTDVTVRLDPSDATFVDVMHTNGASILKLGYGMIQPCGHVDYFPNEGYEQPGCDKNPIDQIRIEGDIFNGGKEFVACNHLRAYKYFTESINSACPFNGYTCKGGYANFQRGMCLPCTGGGCGYMGFHADRVKPRTGQTHVKYYLNTGDSAPFCRYHYQVDITFGKLASASSEKGHLYVNLHGSNGQSGEKKLTEDALTVVPGHRYGFLLMSTHDIGSLQQLHFRWELDSHWYNPLTWSLLSKHAIHVDRIDVVNGETDAKRTFCGFNAEIASGVTRQLTSSSC